MEMKVELLAITPDPELVIERAGRTCYQSQEKMTPETTAKFIRGIVKSGHHSVLEHAYATFRITGCSRAMTHQLVRHRFMAISQESQRYCDEKGMAKRGYFVVPRAVREMSVVSVIDLGLDSPEQNDVSLGGWYAGWMFSIDQAYQQLQAMIREGKRQGLTQAKSNEDARFLLPNACASEIVISANFREFRHIFTVRCDSHAQWEIRGGAIQMLRLLKACAPSVFGDFVEDGTGFDACAKTEYPS